MTAGQTLTWPDRAVTVSVPATSANLGPGFDALGLALTLYDVIEARITDGGLAIEVSGTGEAAASAGEKHLVVRAMRAAFAVLGAQPPGIALRCVNAIPQGFGLGSSAGAIVAGLLAARALSPDALSPDALSPDALSPGAPWPDDVRGGVNAVLDDTRLLRLATRLEGHSDNVAACLAGGLTVAWTSAAGTNSARLSPVAGLAPVVCVPERPVATDIARQALPLSVPHADATANSARTALLIAALTTDPGLLFDATEDFLHQRYRAASMPATTRLVAALRAAGVPAMVSGAGPSVLALTVSGRKPGADTVASAAAAAGTAWQVLPLTVDREGALSPERADSVTLRPTLTKRIVVAVLTLVVVACEGIFLRGPTPAGEWPVVSDHGLIFGMLCTAFFMLYPVVMRWVWLEGSTLCVRVYRGRFTYVNRCYLAGVQVSLDGGSRPTLTLFDLSTGKQVRVRLSRRRKERLLALAALLEEGGAKDLGAAKTAAALRELVASPESHRKERAAARHPRR